MIFQYLQFQLTPFKIWVQYVILHKGRQPEKRIVEIDLQIQQLKNEIIDLTNYLINKFQIKDFNRLFIHCGTGDFYFTYGEKLTEPDEKGTIYYIATGKETEPISLEQLIPEKVKIIRNITSQLIKFKKPDFDDTDLFYSKHQLMTVKEYKAVMRKAGHILTDKEAIKELDKSKIELDKFIKERPDLRKWKEEK